MIISSPCVKQIKIKFLICQKKTRIRPNESGYGFKEYTWQYRSYLNRLAKGKRRASSPYRLHFPKKILSLPNFPIKIAVYGQISLEIDH